MTTILIPARYGSSRFPGKPLVPILGVPLVVRVARNAAATGFRTVVVTDDARIEQVCSEAKIESIRVDDDVPTGTDRVAIAASRLGLKGTVVNVQGDEPLLPPDVLSTFIEEHIRSGFAVSNAMSAIGPEVNESDETIPKVVHAPNRVLLYISRSVVPNTSKGGADIPRMRQVGIYAFDVRNLAEYRNLGRRGTLEEAEDVEILRFIELQTPVGMVEVRDYGPAVDLPSHVKTVSNLLTDMVA